MPSGPARRLKQRSGDSARARIRAAMTRGWALVRAERKQRRRQTKAPSQADGVYHGQRPDDDPLVLAVLRIVAAALAGR
jgi:hypothetical protein